MLIESRQLLLVQHGQNLIAVLTSPLQYLDFGDDFSVPEQFNVKELQSSMWWRQFVSGAVAGAVSRTCTAPLDRLKIYLQVHGTSSMSVFTALRRLLSEGGFFSLWRGNAINVIKIAPESAIKFMAYEQAKNFLKNKRSKDLAIQERFIAGSVAGGVAQTVIYPLEVLKTRLALRKTGEYGSIVDAVKKIYSREGLRCFYRGYVPNLLGILPYAGIDLALYETLKNNYVRKRGRKNEAVGVPVLLVCGTVSSTCGQIATYPLALIRTRLQASQIKPTPTMTSMLSSILKQEGFSGLYRGLTPNFLKVAPAVSISYVVYEHCRSLLGATMT